MFFSKVARKVLHILHFLELRLLLVNKNFINCYNTSNILKPSGHVSPFSTYTILAANEIEI